jgi:integrase/recombinase XerD
VTIARNDGGGRADEAGWPWSHRKTFLERLGAQGYAAVTIQEYRTIAGRLCEGIEKRALRIGDLDGATTERLRHAVLSGVSGSARSYAKFCLRRFIEHLSETGVATVPEPPAKKATALDRLRDEYEAYLRRQRGLAESTIAHCTRFLERFVVFRFGDKLGDLNAITPDDIVAFLCKLKPDRSPAATRRCRLICAACSSSCSGAARPGAISPTACRASPPAPTICRAISSPNRSSG